MKTGVYRLIARAVCTGPSAAFASPAERFLSAIPDAGINDPPVARKLVLRAFDYPSQHRWMPTKLTRCRAYRSPGADKLEGSPYLCGSLRINLHTTRPTPTIPIRQLAPLTTRTSIPLYLGLPSSCHSSDDHPPVIRCYCMADPVEQHRRRIAGTVAIGAVGIQHLDACVREGPQSIVRSELVTGKSCPLSDEQNTRAMFETGCERLGKTGALSHRQRAGAVLEYIADDDEPICSGVALARFALAFWT